MSGTFFIRSHIFYAFLACFAIVPLSSSSSCITLTVPMHCARYPVRDTHIVNGMCGIVHAKWSLVFQSVNNSYWPKTALSSLLIQKNIDRPIGSIIKIICVINKSLIYFKLFVLSNCVTKPYDIVDCFRMFIKYSSLYVQYFQNSSFIDIYKFVCVI